MSVFSLRINENAQNPHENMLYLITSVKNHNLWGRMNMVLVAVIHPYIVKKLFENID